MSYGYQGPPPVVPFRQRKAPTSFGAPPREPSAPGAPPYPQNSGIGFVNSPPTSFGIPQPQASGPYPPQSAPYPPQSAPYPPQSAPYPPQSAPYPPQSAPHPPQSAPYPSQPASYLQQATPYPAQHSPYPAQSSPYSGQASSYSAQTSPYPAQTYPYPAQASSYPQQSTVHPTKVDRHSYSPYANSNPGVDAPLQSYHSNPYPDKPGAQPSGGYSGGQGSVDAYPRDVGTMSSSSLRRSAPSPRQVQANPKTSPTVIPYDGFDPRADAETLRKAMKGWGTDEKSIINVLANRSNLQRQEIAVQFKTLYGKDLIKDLKSELSGNFENLIVAMMTPLPQFYARELHDAMAGIGTDECVLIEVLCSMSNHEINVIRQAYQAMYGRSLEDDLIGDTSGNFKRLMVSLCCGNRDESNQVDQAAAMNDAKELLQAGELRFGTDESKFNEVLVQRNPAQLKQIFREYENITGHSIETAIENEFSGDIKKGLLAIAKCIQSRPAFFAEQLYKSMKGLGTDDRRLIRLVVTRSEVDMGEIKQAFADMYGQSLEDFIADDCSGHYKKCLLALVS